MKAIYIKPLIIEEKKLEVKTSMLVGSVVDKNTEVFSAGQEVEDYTIDTFDADGNSLWY